MSSNELNAFQWVMMICGVIGVIGVVINAIWFVDYQIEKRKKKCCVCNPARKMNVEERQILNPGWIELGPMPV